MREDYFEYQDFFSEVFKASAGSILYHKSGLTVHLNFERITEIGTFPNACAEVCKYFPMKDGDAVLLNDPYTGGGILTNFSLIMGSNLSGVGKDAEFLVGVKFSIRPTLAMTDHLDKEGLKVPPTPVLENRRKIDSIIDAVCGHPLADPSLKTHLEMGLKELLQLEKRIKESSTIWGIVLDKKSVEKYIDFSNRKMKDFLTKVKNRKVTYKEQWVTGELVSVQVEKTPDKLFVEFFDCEKSDFYKLTSSACFGACFSALLNCLETQIPLNSGSIDCLEVKVPNKSFLNSQYPSPVFLGFTEGAGLIANFFSKVLSKLNKELSCAEGNVGVCSIDVLFPTGEHFYDRLASGLGASAENNGNNAIDKWNHHNLQASIEDIELRFPLRIRSTSYRIGSGGNGNQSGGDGIVRSYLFLSPAKIQWFSAMTGNSVESSKGAGAGLGPQFILLRDGKREKLSLYGERELLEGDRIDILTAGGGGFGGNNDF